jgi:hypothetical protein
MAQLFTKKANIVPIYVLIALILLIIIIIGAIWYWGSPYYTDVGYQPEQPVPYSHKFHVGELGMDCRYCHTGVEKSAVAGIPPTQTCMNCHVMVKPASDSLKVVKASWDTNKPIQWVRVHKSPDYVYFDHSAHVNIGVGCKTCHGRIDRMNVVMQSEPLSMSWCLDCHRNPEEHLRPVSEITNMNWLPDASHKEFAQQMIQDLNITPPTGCQGCHR